MGQLEKYGLYVLCLVIFLILGVTIWGGGDPSQAARSKVAPMKAPVSSGPVSGGPAGSGAAKVGVPGTVPSSPGGEQVARAPAEPPIDLDSLLSPEPRSGDAKKVGDGKPVDAGGKSGTAEPVDAGGAGAAKGDPVAAKPDAVGDGKRPRYKVQQGDSFESIARSKFGDAKLKEEIVRLNPQVQPTRMQIGQELVLPSAADVSRLTTGRRAAESVVAKAPVLAPTPKGEAKPAAKEKVAAVATVAGERAYVVGKGDTLGRIAQVQLGSMKRIDELRELNPDVDPTRLRIGQRIKLPKK